jgi:NAD(P)-dependent dehydrogenase (short-subunit alcohol dehydrogenase family)
MSLRGKVALVTGGSSGIGYATARALMSEGADVAICARRGARLDDAIQKLRAETGRPAIGQVCDVGKLDQVRSLVATTAATLGRIDVLVNNAGVGIVRPIDELTPEQWNASIDVNLTGVFYCCHAVIPIMKGLGGGDIVNISSRSGRNPFPGGAAYCASKFGLNGLSEAMQLDLSRHHIRVTYVMPGRVATDFAGEQPQPWHVGADDVAQAIVDLIAQPRRTLVGSIELRPAEPPR